MRAKLAQKKYKRVSLQLGGAEVELEVDGNQLRAKPRLNLLAEELREVGEAKLQSNSRRPG